MDREIAASSSPCRPRRSLRRIRRWRPPRCAEVRSQVGVERLGGECHSVGAAREREHRRDDRGGDARAADRAPVEHVFPFASSHSFRSRTGVIDRDPGVGVRIRGHVRDGTPAFAAHGRPVGDGPLPRRRRERRLQPLPRRLVFAVGVVVVVPDGLASQAAGFRVSWCRPPRRRRGRKLGSRCRVIRFVAAFELFAFWSQLR